MNQEGNLSALVISQQRSLDDLHGVWEIWSCLDPPVVSRPALRHLKSQEFLLRRIWRYIELSVVLKTQKGVLFRLLAPGWQR